MSVRDLPDPATLARQREEAFPLATDIRNRVAYARLSAPLPRTLAVVGFGTLGAAPPDAPLFIDVGLQPLGEAGDVAEVWLADGPVNTGQVGAIRYAADNRALFGLIELDEREYGSLAAAAEAAYEHIAAFQSNSAFPALLRMWNYMDAINDGEGDLERYRQFCVGRALGLAATPAEQYPAASGIGRQHATHKLQVYWVAARSPGRPIENPRQVSAYRYPREHGPTSPSFSRASIASDGTMFVSGTASIVGHLSLHDGNPLAQLEETVRNLEALASADSIELGGHRLLKVYVRRRTDADLIARSLRQRLAGWQALILAGDICRRELLLEIEAII